MIIFKHLWNIVDIQEYFGCPRNLVDVQSQLGRPESFVDVQKVFWTSQVNFAPKLSLYPKNHIRLISIRTILLFPSFFLILFFVYRWSTNTNQYNHNLQIMKNLFRSCSFSGSSDSSLSNEKSSNWSCLLTVYSCLSITIQVCIYCVIFLVLFG